MKVLCVILLSICLLSCQNRNKKQAERILNDWMNKEILFPDNLRFSIQGTVGTDFSIHDSEYKIVVYVDSMGCTSCRLHLSEWEKYINHMDSIYSDNIQFLFFFFPKNERDIYITLRTGNFKYPVCIDTLDVLNKLNHFPTDMRFQTFLLNKKNQVLAIGNPIKNPQIKELFAQILSGKQDSTSSVNQSLTTAVLSMRQIDMGNFSWENEKEEAIEIFNTGKETLVINEIITSCGCITVDYSVEPIRPGASTILNVKYKTEHPEYFNKTISIYCNVENAPLILKISGNAE